MKKRLFMAFTLSMFIVSIMSAAAMASKPTFSNASDISSAVSALVYNNDDVYSLTLTVTASPDLKKVTVDNKKPIAGITITVGDITAGDDDTQSSCEITIAGTPTEAVKGKKVTVTATNSDGDTKLKLTFNSTAEELTISTVTGTLPGQTEGGTTVMQGTKLSNVVVRAVPGPVTWKAKDLPKGITTKVSGDTDLVLSGTYSGLTAYSAAIGATSADAKKSHFTLTAKNKAVDEPEAETSGDIFVVTSPDTKMKSFPALTLGKDYKAQIKMINYPKSIAVYFGQNESEAKTSTATTTASIKDSSETSIGTLELTSDDKGWYITGSCDRMPVSGSIYARIAAVGQNNVEVTNVATLQIPFKGVAPAFDKPDNLDLSEGDVVFQISKGTKPIVVSIDIADKVRQSYGSSNDVTIIGGSTSENGSTVAWNELGFSVTTTMGGANDDYIWRATLTPTTATDDTLAEAYKGLKLTLKATNPVTGTTKVVKKDFGISKNADTEVVWTNNGTSGSPTASSTEVTGTTINVKNQKGGEDLEAGSADTQALIGGVVLPEDALKALQFYTNVPKPYTIALSGDKAVNGLSVGFTPDSDGGGILAITGTPTKSKDTVTKFKLVATNTLTKKKAQVNVNISAYAEPAFTNAKDLAAGKEVVAGKKVSIKGKMKAHKDLLPTVTYSDVEDTTTALTALGLEFTSDAKGAFEIAGAAGETKPTLNSESTAYDSKDVTIKWKDAFNGTTEQSATVRLRITPLQPKIKTSKVVYTMTADEATNTEQSIELSNITSETVGTSLKYGPTALFDGAALAEDTGVITFTKASLTPTKSKAVNVSVDNYGVKSATKSVKFTINAPKPIVTAGSATLDITGSATDKVEKTVTFTADSSTTGGDTKLKWKISTKPDGLSAKIKAAADTKSATVTITAKKGSQASGAISLGVTATNTVSKEESDEVTVTINATAAPEKSSATKDGEARDRDTATDEAAEPMKEEDVEVGEGEVILGKARTEAALTATQRTAIAEAGYVVVAVLPEVEVTAAGQYPLPVEIPEEIAAGKELAWFAFSTKPSEDDEIVDFFDEEGKDTKVVPESHKITVYPWLNADVTYAPVIAVKADTGEKGAETEEQIKEKTVRAVKK